MDAFWGAALNSRGFFFFFFFLPFVFVIGGFVLQLQYDGELIKLDSINWTLGEPVFQGSVNDHPITVQVAPTGVGQYTIIFRGTPVRVCACVCVCVRVCACVCFGAFIFAAAHSRLLMHAPPPPLLGAVLCVCAHRD